MTQLVVLRFNTFCERRGYTKQGTVHTSVLSAAINCGNPDYYTSSMLPGNPSKGQRQTVQTQIRRHIIYSVLLTGFPIKNRIKATK